MPERNDDRRIKLRQMIKQRAEAPERGAIPAAKIQDLDYTIFSKVKMWLVDTGCGYDIVSKRETAKIKRFLSKARCGITFHIANGATRTEDVANIYVKDLDENITPYVLDNTPPVLTVGYRCLEMGSTFVWLAGENPYFIRPDGNLVLFGGRALYSLYYS